MKNSAAESSGTKTGSNPCCTAVCRGKILFPVRLLRGRFCRDKTKASLPCANRSFRHLPESDFEAASNHRYNTSDYLSVDPILGSDYDLTELSKAAAEYGHPLNGGRCFFTHRVTVFILTNTEHIPRAVHTAARIRHIINGTNSNISRMSTDAGGGSNPAGGE